MTKRAKERRVEVVRARVSATEKLALYRLAAKCGGLSAAMRHLIRQHMTEQRAPPSAACPNGNRAGSVLADPSAVAPTIAIQSRP